MYRFTTLSRYYLTSLLPGGGLLYMPISVSAFNFKDSKLMGIPAVRFEFALQLKCLNSY
jgi:hypothetical protein